MRKSFDDYTHLAGSARSGSSLWAGPDHLLVIETMPLLGFSEQYKRIDYAKIETISYGRTKSFWWSLAWQLVLLLLLAIGVFSTYEEALPAAIFFGVIGLIVAIVLTVHLVRGPTCVCRLQTAVQVLKLKPLNRLRYATQVAARLRQLCLQHQGGVEATPEALQAAQAEPPSLMNVSSGIRPVFSGSRIVTLAFLLLLPAGALIIGEPFVPSFGYFFADCLVGLLAHTLAVIALAMVFRFQTPGGLKFSLWGASANLVISFITGYTLLIMASIEQVKTATRSPEGIPFGSGAEFSVWQWMSGATFDDIGWLAWVFVITGVLDVIYGLVGLAVTRRPAAIPAAPAPVPPPLTASSPPPPPPAPAPGGDELP